MARENSLGTLALGTVAAARICVGVAMVFVPGRFFKQASGTETLLMRTIGIRLKDALRMTQLVDDPRQAAASLEGLAWIAAEKGDSRRAVVMMAAAETLVRAVGTSTVFLPHLLVFHEECERRTREALGAKEFEAARQEGRSFSFDNAITYALGKPPSSVTTLARRAP